MEQQINEGGGNTDTNQDGEGASEDIYYNNNTQQHKTQQQNIGGLSSNGDVTNTHNKMTNT
jgi:hypothetical protein